MKIQYMKIAYFSPLTPIKSGIAEYSERELLPYLRKLCDIELVVDKGYKPQSEFVNKNFKVIDYRDFDSNYDKILYHMGNNPFHEYVYEIAIKNPGIVVLHDPFIHHLIRRLTVGRKNKSRYVEIMEYCLGPKGKVIAENALATREFPLFEYPLVKELVDSSSGIIVHSEFAEKIVKEESPDVIIKKIKMPITIPQKSQENKLKEKLKIPENYTVIATFGNVGFYKRLNVCLKSFSHYLKKNPNSMFLIVGAFLNEKYNKEIHNLIKELGISDKVIETGFVDNLFSYVEIADIVIQLRYPTAGETSIITLQIMGSGKPVIVTNIASFSELPDESVIKIEPDVSEEVSLYNALLKLTNEKSYSKVLSSNARKYIENEHDPEKISKEYFEFLSTTPKKEPRKLNIEVAKVDIKETPVIKHKEMKSLEEISVIKHKEMKSLEEISEEEMNVSQLDVKNINSGKRLIKKLRFALHREVRDWIVYPFQKKQTKFNRKAARNISKINSNVNLIKSEQNSIKSEQNSIKSEQNELKNYQIKVDVDFSKKVEEAISFNLTRRIDSLIEQKFTSLRDIFELETKIKTSFIEILKRYPNEDELREYVNKIKNNKISFEDFKKELSNKQK